MENDSIQRIWGRVKWFDPVKGFGFVEADHGGADILLHANVLRNFGQSSVADDAIVDLEVQNTPRGVQATFVYELLPPDDGSQSGFSDLDTIDPEVLRAAPLQPARIKWFDKSKGFGFANIFGQEGDIFVHVEVLRRSGLAEVQPGEALAIRVVEGDRGRIAMEVNGWESAVE